MKVPVFYKTKVVDEKGYFTPQVQQLLDVFFQQMQLNLSDNGFQIPQLTTDQINQLVHPSNNNQILPGCVWYDSDEDKFKGNVNGVVKTFQVS